jgi:exoribonuclease R
MDRVYHMLPEEYASNIISLNKKGVKRAVTVIFRITEAGVQWHGIQLTHVKVGHSLTYEEAQQIMDDEVEVYSDISNSLTTLSFLTETRDTHKMIEKIMIWTNEAVGRYIYDNGANLSVYCPAPPASQIPEDLKRPATRAEYSVNKHGHGMMGLEYYTHFTSPIRRYADLVVHRIVKNILAGRQTDMDKTREDVSLINDITGKSKRYYRDQSILKVLRLKELPTVAYILDFQEANIVSLYIKDISVTLRTRLFADELLPIYKVQKDKEFIVIDKQGSEVRIPMYAPVIISITCFPAEIKLHRKLKISFTSLALQCTS